MLGGTVMKEQHNDNNVYHTERGKYMTTTIQKWGNSQGIRLPKHILDAMHWNDNEQINIRAENNKIVIEKAVKKERKDIKELFAQFNDEYESTDIDWGNPTGKEIW